MPVGTDIKNLFSDSSHKTNTVSGIDLIKQEVEFLLLFQKYSLFFGNEIGFSPEKYLSLRNREATFNLIRSELQKVFSKYKRAVIKEISMSFEEGTSKLVVDLTLATSTYGNNTFNVSLDLGN